MVPIFSTGSLQRLSIVFLSNVRSTLDARRERCQSIMSEMRDATLHAVPCVVGDRIASCAIWLSRNDGDQRRQECDQLGSSDSSTRWARFATGDHRSTGARLGREYSHRTAKQRGKYAVSWYDAWSG